MVLVVNVAVNRSMSIRLCAGAKLVAVRWASYFGGISS